MLRRHPLQFAAAFLIIASSLCAQMERSSIEGVVTDPQGAGIAGATVTVTSQSTNVATPTKTNGTGYYQIIGLLPGKYTVRIEAAGFAVTQSNDVDAAAGRQVRLDAALTLGTTQQHIEVNAAAPLVETSSSNFSAMVSQQAIEDTPLAGRDLMQLVYLLPGVENAAGPPGSNFGFSSQYGTFPDPSNAQGSDISVNGGQAGANAWYLDGNLNLSGLVENMAVNPSPDAVTEFQAVTEGISAQYGRTGGGVFNVVLKSGTNHPHGDLYEFVRNSDTNARNPFTSIDSTGHLIPDKVLHYNDFGGTFGGPVVIPKLYNGKDKTFFFASVDHTVLHLTGQSVFSVPTQAMRTGDFSEDPSSSAYGIYDPYSTVGPNADGTFQRTAFGTALVPNGCTNTVIESSATPTCQFSTQIPTSRLDPVAMFFLKSFPLPNYVNPLSNCPMGKSGYAICSNYLGTIGSSQDPYNISVKLDHQLSDKSRLFFEVLTNPGKYGIYRTPWTGATVPYQGFGGNTPYTFTSEVAGIGHTYIASPTFFNEFRMSFSRQVFNTNPSEAGFPDSVTDLPQVQQVLAPSQIFLSQFTPSPTFQISMPGGGSANFGSPGWINQRQANDAYTILDDVTKIIGRHTIKTGFMYRLDQQGREISDPSTLAFYGTLANDPTTGLGGNGLEQFMMGAVANSGTGITSQPYSSYPYWGLYIQDEFRILPNLTINVGLRDDMIFFWKSRDHPESNFCLDCLNPATGLQGEMVYEGQSSLIPKDAAIAPPHLADVAPRFSFAWNPFNDKKTVIRGGYNMFYTNAINAINNIGQGIQPGAQWQSFSNWTGSFYPSQCGEYSGECVAFPLSDTTTNKATLTIPPIPANGQPPAANYDPSYGASLQFYYPPAKDPRVQTYTFQIQRELSPSMLLSIGYVGNHGTHLAGEAWRQFNLVPVADEIQYKTQLNANVPISNYFSGAQAALLQQTWGSSSIPLSYVLKPYPFYGALFSQTMYDGESVYNGMNVRFQKRLSSGLSALVAYTYSKKIYNASVEQLASQLFDTIALSRNGIIGGRASATSSVGGTGGINGGGYQDPDNRNLDRSIAYDDIPHMLNIVFTYELPVGKGRTWLNHSGPLNVILGGWRLAGNFNAESGVPLNISGPCNQLTCRPNLVGNPTAVPGGQNASDWINAAAFTPVFGTDQNFWANPNLNDPREWVFGTAGEYLPGLRSPAFWNIDGTLMKDFHFTEHSYLQFRWEVYNALNHQNLGYPNTNYCLPAGPGGETNLVQQAGCSFGRITNIATDPRSLQFAMKLYF
jgi:hypothetical protein